MEVGNAHTRPRAAIGGHNVMQISEFHVYAVRTSLSFRLWIGQLLVYIHISVGEWGNGGMGERGIASEKATWGRGIPQVGVTTEQCRAIASSSHNL